MLRKRAGGLFLIRCFQKGMAESKTLNDPNAIRIVVHIHSIRRRTVIGYVPKGLARELAKVIDMGIQVKASLMQIIGGYSYKESLGVLVNIAV